MLSWSYCFKYQVVELFLWIHSYAGADDFVCLKNIFLNNFHSVSLMNTALQYSRITIHYNYNCITIHYNCITIKF